MLKALFKGIDTMTDAMLVASTTAMCIVIFIQILTRYVLSYSLPWAEECGRFLFLALSYLGISSGMKNQGHLRVDIFVMYMPRHTEKFFNILSMFVSALFFLFIVWAGSQMTLKVYRIEQLAVSLPLPIWMVWACIPFSALLTALQCFGNMYTMIYGRAWRDESQGEGHE